MVADRQILWVPSLAAGSFKGAFSWLCRCKRIERQSLKKEKERQTKKSSEERKHFMKFFQICSIYSLRMNKNNVGHCEDKGLSALFSP